MSDQKTAATEELSKVDTSTVLSQDFALPSDNEEVSVLKLNSTLREEKEENVTGGGVWHNIIPDDYLVRDGPHYYKDKYSNKTVSANAQYEVISADFVTCDSKISDFTAKLELPVTTDTIDTYGLPPYQILNWMLPGYVPSMSEEIHDGIGFSFITVAKLTEATKAMLLKAKEAGVDINMLAQEQGIVPDSDSDEEEETEGAMGSFFSWATGDTSKQDAKDKKHKARHAEWKKTPVGTNATDMNPTGVSAAAILFRRFVNSPEWGSFRSNTLRVMGAIQNIEDAAFPFVLKPFARATNATPFLVEEAAKYGSTSNAFCISIDVHEFSYFAKVGLAACRDILPSLIFDTTVCIQGQFEDELPEAFLIAYRVYNLDFEKTKKVVPK